MKTLKTLAALATFAAAAAVLPAQANPCMSGDDCDEFFNGPELNGLVLNGIVLNGLVLNGTPDTGIKVGTPIAITLPDDTK